MPVPCGRRRAEARDIGLLGPALGSVLGIQRQNKLTSGRTNILKNDCKDDYRDTAKGYGRPSGRSLLGEEKKDRVKTNRATSLDAGLEQGVCAVAAALRWRP